MGAQVLTANRLRDGAVVYLSAEGEWVREIDRAAVADDEAAAAALTAAGEGAVAGRRVVAPYLIEVETASGGLKPGRYRERLRAEGPSIRFGSAVRSA